MRGGWQRDEQFDHDCLLPEREEIEEVIKVTVFLPFFDQNQ